jgi:HSP20 family protein
LKGVFVDGPYEADPDAGFPIGTLPMAKQSKRNSKHTARDKASIHSGDLLLHGHDFLDPYKIGSWTPHVDICQAEDQILVRVELPGVDSSDISLSFQGDTLRLQGLKREPHDGHKLFCYYCLERRFGRFERHVDIGWLVNPRKARAYLDKGILTVELPKLKERRGEIASIQVKEKF